MSDALTRRSFSVGTAALGNVDIPTPGPLLFDRNADPFQPHDLAIAPAVASEQAQRAGTLATRRAAIGV